MGVSVLLGESYNVDVVDVKAPGHIPVALGLLALVAAVAFVGPGRAGAQTGLSLGVPSRAESQGGHLLGGSGYGVGVLNVGQSRGELLRSTMARGLSPGGSVLRRTGSNLAGPESPGRSPGSLLGRVIADIGLPGELTPKTGGMASAVLGADTGGILAADKYLRSIGAVIVEADARGEAEPITSLVPEESGLYRDHMAQGEAAFRSGNMREALARFHQARSAAGTCPEITMSLMHTRFALSRFSYVSASYYLQETLTHLPELPLAPLKPRGFYGDPAAYLERIDRLKKHLSESPRDANGHLVLAYFQWFDEDTARARQSLLAAWKLSRAPRNASSRAKAEARRMREAIDIFWKGMVRSGRVSGALPADPLRPTSKPARPAPSPAPGKQEGGPPATGGATAVNTSVRSENDRQR